MLTLTDEQLQDRGFKQCGPGRWCKRTRSTAINYHKVDFFEVPIPQWCFGDWMHPLIIENESDLNHLERILGKHIPEEKSNETIGKDKEKL